MRIRHTGIAALAAAVLVLSGCGGDEPDGTAVPGGSEPATSAPAIDNGPAVEPIADAEGAVAAFGAACASKFAQGEEFAMLRGNYPQITVNKCTTESQGSVTGLVWGWESGDTASAGVVDAHMQEMAVDGYCFVRPVGDEPWAAFVRLDKTAMPADLAAQHDAGFVEVVPDVVSCGLPS